MIPVLVGGATAPSAEDLPEELEDLCKRQMAEVRSARFEADADELIAGIGGWRRRWHGLPLWVWMLMLLAFIAAIVAPLLWPDNEPPVAIPEPVAATGGEPVEIDILSWASDDRTKDLTLVVDAVSAENATIEQIEGGRVVYTAPAEFFGTDSFGFKVIDGGGLDTTATAFVSVQLGKLGGDFNVAVAEFSTAGSDDDAAGRLSESIFEQVSTALEESSDVRLVVARPAAVGSIGGATADSRAELASELATRIDADVVVYGTVEVGADFAVITAEFYLSERGLAQGEELAGPYSLGSLELATSDPLALSLAAADFLEPRISALSQLAIGLSYYQLNDYAEAERRFLDASAAWPGSQNDSNGQEVVFHLLGNAVGHQEDRLDDAEDFYLRALALNPDYARSHFGVAEVLFQRSKGANCDGTGEADLDGLRQAIRQFEDVMASEAPPLSFLDARSSVEIARIHFCLNANGEDSVDEARRELELVVAEYATETRLRNLVAEAQQVLGAISFAVGDLDAATDYYVAAIDRTLDPAREAAFHRALAAIYLCYLDAADLANESYDESERLIGEPAVRSECNVQ